MEERPSAKLLVKSQDGAILFDSEIEYDSPEWMEFGRLMKVEVTAKIVAVSNPDKGTPHVLAIVDPTL